MTKTIEEWREKVNKLVQDKSNEMAKLIIDHQSEIMLAFCAKYGLMPDEIVLCYQGNRFWVEKKNSCCCSEAKVG